MSLTLSFTIPLSFEDCIQRLEKFPLWKPIRQDYQEYRINIRQVEGYGCLFDLYGYLNDHPANAALVGSLHIESASQTILKCKASITNYHIIYNGFIGIILFSLLFMLVLYKQYLIGLVVLSFDLYFSYYVLKAVTLRNKLIEVIKDTLLQEY